MPILIKLLVMRIVASNFRGLASNFLSLRTNFKSFDSCSTNLIFKEKKATSAPEIKAEQINKIKTTMIAKMGSSVKSRCCVEL